MNAQPTVRKPEVCNPQAPVRHLPAVEPRFRGGAQRLGMRAASSNSRGGVFTWPHTADGARCCAKPQPSPASLLSGDGTTSLLNLGARLTADVRPFFWGVQR